MNLSGWIRRRQRGNDALRQRWRAAWTAAVEAGDAARLDELRAQLTALELRDGEDVELELEMLDALERLGAVRHETMAGALPTVETQHRVISGETCHFTAPASLPDDPSQSSGRVLFTSSRSVFVGGAPARPVAWHLVGDIVRHDRDVLLVRGDGSGAAHFRFNTFADAVVAAFLARRLKGAKGSRGL